MLIEISALPNQPVQNEEFGQFLWTRCYDERIIKGM